MNVLQEADQERARVLRAGPSQQEDAIGLEKL